MRRLSSIFTPATSLALAGLAGVALLPACSGGAPRHDVGRSYEAADSGGEWRGAGASGGGADYGEADAAPLALSTGGTFGASSGGPVGGVAVEHAPRGQTRSGLRGGEIDDAARFDDFVAYYQEEARRGRIERPLELHERHRVVVTDADGAPLPFARVVARDRQGSRALFTGRTGPDGAVTIYPRAFAATRGRELWLEASHDGASGGRAARPGSELVTIPLAVRGGAALAGQGQDQAPHSERARLDLHFIIDTTGSMADEIHRLKVTMRDVSRRIATLPSRPLVRYGLTAYRDEGDEYVTRTWDFVRGDDLDAFLDRLAALEAGGGGDYPEAVEAALEAAVLGPTWDVDGAVEVAFLIADAPPHQWAHPAVGTGHLPDQARSWEATALAAVDRGIRIYPVAASGLDDRGEAIFRTLALLTGGRFLYISYGGATPHKVGGFAENDLDDLIVRVVTEELEALATARERSS